MEKRAADAREGALKSSAERILAKLLDCDPEAREEFAENYKLKYDPRVTWLGRFLRRSSLDELPQIINVLRGELPGSVLGRSWFRNFRNIAVMRPDCCA